MNDPKPFWKKPIGITLIILAAILTIGIINAITGDSADQPDSETTTTTEETVTEEPTTEQPSEEPVTQAPQQSPQEWADSIEDRILADLAADNWQQAGTTWAPFINGFTATNIGQLHIGLQIPGGDPDAEELAQGVLDYMRINYEGKLPDLDFVIVNDGTGTVIEQESIK